jgi:hypothetical protein
VLAGCVTLLTARGRRRAAAEVHADSPATDPLDNEFTSGARSPSGVGPLLLITGAVAFSVTPFWGAVVLAAGGCEIGARRLWRPIPVTAVVGLVAATWVGVSVAVIERRDSPFPNAGWTVLFEHLNGMALAAVALVAASTLFTSPPTRIGSPARPNQ